MIGVTSLQMWGFFIVNFSWNWMEKLYNLFYFNFFKKTIKLLQRQDLGWTYFNWNFLYYSLLIVWTCKKENE